MNDTDYGILREKLSDLNIETERTCLRRYIDSDEDGFMAIFTDRYTMEMDGDEPLGSKNEMFYRRIDMVRSGELIFVCIEDKSSHDFIGYVLINKYPAERERTVTLGYSLVPKYQHKGYGTEAVRKVIEVLSESGTVSTILVSAYRFNDASLRLIRKLGFLQTGEDDRKEYYAMSIAD